MYKYKNTKDAYTNDLVMWTNLPEGISNRIPYKVYLVKRKDGNSVEILGENNKLQLYGKLHGFKVLKTKPASQAKVGDYIFRLSEGTEQFPKGEIRKVISRNSIFLSYKDGFEVGPNEVIAIEADDEIKEENRYYPYFLQGFHDDGPMVIKQDKGSYKYLHIVGNLLLGKTFEGTHVGAKPCDFTIEPEIYDLDWYQQRFKSGLPVYAIDSNGCASLCKGLSPKQWHNTTRFSITDKKIPKQNDKYQYLDRQPEDGDVVERIKCGSLPEESVGNLAIIGQKHFNQNENIDGNPAKDTEWWRVVKTLPGSEAKVGDTCIRVKHSANNRYNGSKIGDVFKVTHKCGACIGYYDGYSSNSEHVRVLVLADNKPTAKDNINNDQTLGAQEEPTITNNQKENKMKLQQILDAIFGVSDYEKKPNFIVTVFNKEKEVATTTADSIEEIKQTIQEDPRLWGCKLVAYKLNCELQTQVPVTTTKLNKKEKDAATE